MKYILYATSVSMTNMSMTNMSMTSMSMTSVSMTSVSILTGRKRRNGGIVIAMKLMLGNARAAITPELGGLFAGYGSPKPSTGVHDDLTATAIFLEYGGVKVLFLGLTIIGVGNELTAELRDICGKAAGVPAENVLISSVHTHSGPLFRNGDPEGYVDAILRPKLLAVSGEAAGNARPVTVGIATTKTLVGCNRRKLLRDGKVILAQNPWGAYDSEMTVISFKGEDGRAAANIVHCAAHNTSAGINTEVTRDWCGVMIDRLEAETGGMTAFFNGCAGDICPRTANGGSTADISQTMEIGAVAGIDAVRAYNDIREYRDLDLAVVTDEVRIPYAPIKPLAQAEAEYDAIKDSTERFHPGMAKLLKEVIEMHEKGDAGPADFTHQQTIVRLGPAVFIPVPFEPSTEISLRLRAYSKFGYTLAMGYCNGSNSYLPSQDQLCRGGYEVERFRWSKPRQLPDDADTLLINENLRIMDKL